MKTVLQSFISAFSMYSKIPVPTKSLDKDCMRYAMCFFPVIGAVIGFLVLLWMSLTYYFNLNFIIRAVGCVSIPVLLTGGIHVDGFLDTMDALASHQSQERRLEILKDSNCGAFAIIFGIVYFLLLTVSWTQLNQKALIILAIGFILSRSLSALSVVTFRLAKNTGLVYAFANAQDKKVVRVVVIIYIVLCAAAMIFVEWFIGLLVLAGAGIAFGYYRYKSYRAFGGITGDLAGYFLQLAELLMAMMATAAVVIGL